ncbi:hypothetical protein A1O3_00680 [Capronia epimyces CBS 606.96]|uniref:Uncharacterized protein n=1 Tax=Capronia epimyces CBS 606.96 TaxID=1182542 RepID=W9YR29_9EURO|nr:uncharacterized protein A1O3_00680 [Capronia epimyces CBS 606.96]EXJ92130.1 hypothetical protein A1O3_00680 [Capronia epimyces CBS 606.96]
MDYATEPYHDLATESHHGYGTEPHHDLATESYYDHATELHHDLATELHHDHATEPNHHQALLLDYDYLRQHQANLQLLADQIRAAQMTASEQEACIAATIESLWDQNPDLRRRGLRGGAARKARKTGRTYTPIKDMSPDQNHRRRLVEKQDQRERDRRNGIRALKTIFKDHLTHVEYQVEECRKILAREWMTKSGLVAPSPYDIELTDNILTGDMSEMIEEIQAMLETFYDECTL